MKGLHISEPSLIDREELVARFPPADMTGSNSGPSDWLANRLLWSELDLTPEPEFVVVLLLSGLVTFPSAGELLSTSGGLHRNKTNIGFHCRWDHSQLFYSSGVDGIWANEQCIRQTANRSENWNVFILNFIPIIIILFLVIPRDRDGIQWTSGPVRFLELKKKLKNII